MKEEHYIFYIIHLLEQLEEEPEILRNTLIGIAALISKVTDKDKYEFDIDVSTDDYTYEIKYSYARTCKED